MIIHGNQTVDGRRDDDLEKQIHNSKYSSNGFLSASINDEN